MPSKNNFIVIILCLILAACSNETIPDHQASTLVDPSAEVKEETVIKDFSQFDENHKKVESLIESKESSKVVEALQIIQGHLFSPMAKDPNIYTSASYVGYINLYVKVHLYWKANQTDEALNSLYQQSLVKFQNQFVNDCVAPEISNCEMLKSSLRQNGSTVVIVNSLVKNEKDLNKKLRLVGIAYDLAGRRKEMQLDNLYISTLMETLREQKAGKKIISEDELKRHTINMIALFNNIDWSNDNERAVELFEEIAPWENNVVVKTTEDYLRLELIKMLPQFSKVSDVVKNGLKKTVVQKVENLKKDAYDLKSYPAFDNINIESLSNEDPIVVFLALSVYFQEIDLKEASLYLLKIEDKSEAAEKIYSLAKTLVRWDIAQLSIDSTKKLAKEFSKQEVKSSLFVQDNFDYSKQLVPQWTEFHSVRLNSIRKFVNSNQKYMNKTDENTVRDFFASVNRNILKTTVYPNMLAYMYHMAKTEWSDRIKIWFWVIELDSTDIFDYMMTGNYYYPWFNFTNLKEDAGYSDNTRSSLFRSEILDSFYYLLATKTAGEYGIDVDDMVKVISETVLKKRVPKFEEVLNAQRKIYFTGDTAPNQFMNWCNAVSANEKPKEIISFYDLHENLTPYTESLKNTRGVFGAGDIFNARLPLYFADLYASEGFMKHVSVTDVNDMLSTELMPIMHTTSQLLNITERLKQKYPSDIKINMDKSKKYYEDMLRFQQAYLGSQITLSEMMGDCSHITGNESRRRAMKLAEAEYIYYEKIVYPLLMKATKGEISVDEANKIVKDIHKNHYGFYDEFIVVNDKTASYTASRQGYMLRVRELLINGISVENELLGKIEIPAIVGKQLEVPLPSGLIEDEDNPYFNTNGNLRPFRDIKFNINMSASEYATSGVRLVTDELRGIFFSYKYSSWDKSEASKYFEIDYKRVEFLIQRLKLKGQTYIDFHNEKCREYSEPVEEECYKTNEVTIDDLSSEMDKIFKNLELDGQKEKYMELIGYRGFISSNNMSLQIKLDEQGVYDFNIDALPFSEPAGFFDLALHMSKKDYLGLMYTTEYDDYVRSQSNEDQGAPTCSGNREGCYWVNARERAKQYFISRKKRRGIIFNFDKKILEENYDYVKNDITRKLQIPIDIEEKGPELLKKYRGDNLMYKFDLSKKPRELKALSLSKLYNQVDADKFFVEETEGFFIDTPNWDKYLDNK